MLLSPALRQVEPPTKANQLLTNSATPRILRKIHEKQTEAQSAQAVTPAQGGFLLGSEHQTCTGIQGNHATRARPCDRIHRRRCWSLHLPCRKWEPSAED